MDQDPAPQISSAFPTSQPSESVSNNTVPPSTITKVRHHKITLIFSLVFIFLFLVSYAATLITVYSDVKIPLVSNYRKELMLLFYKIPLVPKTPEQILLNAVDKNAEINSYNPNFSMTAQLGSSTIEAASLDLSISGPIELSSDGKKLQFDVKAQGAVNYLGKSYQAHLTLRQIDDSFYAKVDSLSNEIIGTITALFGGFYGGSQTPQNNEEINQNVQKVFENWVSIDTKGLETEARKELEKSSEKSIVDAARKNLQDFLLKSSVLPEVEKLGSEEIEGVDSYHLAFSPDKETLKTIFKEYIESEVDSKDQKDALGAYDEAINGIDDFEMQIWIGKKDSILRKSSLRASINLDFLSQLGANPYSSGYSPYSQYSSFLGVNPKLSLSTVLILKDVNQQFSFQKPPSSITAEEFFKQLTDAFKTKEQKELEAKRTIIDADLSLIQSALTTYYVNYGSYPDGLNSLVSTGSLTDQGLISRIGTYLYRKGTFNVAVFTVFEMPNKYSYYDSSPYYGITTSYTYPHQISASELSSL